jgi:poly-gamma-glutamate capsule biosynthesis protein CapA/YwtB (metallophosphatase superfamily)
MAIKDRGFNVSENNSKFTILAAGDVAPLRDDPDSIFDNVRDVLKKGDISFCQLEINLSRKGSPLPQARLAMQADRDKTARSFKNAGFNVISFAGNHCLDWGIESFADTIDALKEQQIRVVGVGKNISEARVPAIFESKGTKVALLAYNTILPQGYWAEPDRPGCAPMRAFTFYEQVEHDQPGTACRTHTFANRSDLKAMVDDIHKAKAKADVVVLSMHWGIHFVPAVIADYQREMAYAAIDAGADIILGHHAHILKGIEVYKGKAIFYSLCNFALDLAPAKEMLDRPRHKEIMTLNPDWVPDPEYPTYYMPKDSRKTMLVKCTISGGKIERVSFLPTMINKKSQPEILASSDERFNDVLSYVKEITFSQGLPASFKVAGDEVIIG